MTRQIVFEDLGKVAVRAAPAPCAPRHGEVLLRPAFVGICGSDLHVLHGKHPWIRPPVVTGHEMVARVAQVAPDIHDLQPGDAVVLDPLVPCGHCRRCRSGAFNTCENAAVFGFRIPGAAQTSLVVDRKQLHRVPDHIRLEAAVLAEPLAVGVHAAAVWDDLDDVLVIGGGTIGLCVLAALKARGARRVSIVEPIASKRALALQLGACEAVTSGVIAAAPRYTACFDVVAVQNTVDLAGATVQPGGAIVMVGVSNGPLAFPIPRMQRFEITLKGSGMYLGADIDEALRLIATGAVDPAVFVSAIRPLDEAPDAYAEAACADTVKMLIRME